MKKILTGLIAIVAAAIAGFMVAGHDSREAAVTPGHDAAGSPPPAAAAESTGQPVFRLDDIDEPDCEFQKRRLQNQDGGTIDLVFCRKTVDERENYDIYTDPELLVMSYADAGAAAELGKRLLYQRKIGGANEFMLRAVALNPDNIGPLLYLGGQLGSLRGDSPEAREALGNAYVIMRTANHFEPAIDPMWVEPDLVEYGFSEEEIAFLDRLVAANLERMKNVQIEVFGKSTIGEDL